MANNFKKVIDRMMWVQVAPFPNAHGAATAMCSDLRSDVSRNPFAYHLVSAAVLNRYNIVTKAHSFAVNPGLGGTFGAGAAMIFAPSRGLEGTIAAGATTSTVTLSTALPSAVGVNMLANRGGSGEYGFKIRIIGKTAGKTEERFIVGNSGGTTPLIRVDAPFTFTPSSGDGYEILSGRVMMLSAGALAATIYRSFEVSTNTLANLGNTNLPATIGTDTDLLALDEQYTPYNHTPGEGFIKGTFKYDQNLVERFALEATASGSTSITGHATGGDAGVLANEYRNFQIRIVHDAVTPASVGQRRAIASHTAGPSAVYTLGSAWSTTPSSSAKFVIEYPNLILARSTATTTVYTYNYAPDAYNNGTTNLAANTWSTTLFGAAPAAQAASGMWMPSFGIQPDADKNARHSFCYFWRGNASAVLDVLDIAGGTTGSWTGAIVFDGSPGALTTGSCGCYSPFENEGRMFYMNVYVNGAINQLYRFDVQNRVMSPITPPDIPLAGTGALGKRMVAYAAIDGTNTFDVVLLQNHLSTIGQELIVLV